MQRRLGGWHDHDGIVLSGVPVARKAIGTETKRCLMTVRAGVPDAGLRKWSVPRPVQQEGQPSNNEPQANTRTTADGPRLIKSLQHTHAAPPPSAHLLLQQPGPHRPLPWLGQSRQEPAPPAEGSRAPSPPLGPCQAQAARRLNAACRPGRQHHTARPSLRHRLLCRHLHRLRRLPLPVRSAAGPPAPAAALASPNAPRPGPPLSLPPLPPCPSRPPCPAPPRPRCSPARPLPPHAADACAPRWRPPPRPLPCRCPAGRRRCRLQPAALQPCPPHRAASACGAPQHCFHPVLHGPSCQESGQLSCYPQAPAWPSPPSSSKPLPSHHLAEAPPWAPAPAL